MMQPARQHDKPDRSGFTLMEVIVAAGLVGALFLMAIPLLGHVRLVRQEAERRMIAGEEAANALESVAALAQRGALDQEALGRLELSPSAARLPDAALEVELGDVAPPFAGQQVTVRVSWMPETGIPAPPAILTAWFVVEGGE